MLPEAQVAYGDTGGAMQQSNAGRWILTSAAIATLVGGYLADWNRPHLFDIPYTALGASTRSPGI